LTTALVGYYEDDVLRLRYRCRIAPPSMDAFILYEYDSHPGVAYKADVAQVTAFTTDWTEIAVEADIAGGGGGGPGCKITGGGVLLRGVGNTNSNRGAFYARLNILRKGTAYEECLACGFLSYSKPFLTVGEHEDLYADDSWRQWVFQGTVAEDATAGTHVCTLAVTPGTGNEFEVLYGQITGGNTATAQTMAVAIDDGANELAKLLSIQDTAASIRRAFPVISAPSANTNNTAILVSPIRLSGAMRLVLSETTTAVSVTQTFAVTVRFRGAPPTFSLADTVGTPTLTTNTSAEFY